MIQRLDRPGPRYVRQPVRFTIRKAAIRERAQPASGRPRSTNAIRDMSGYQLCLESRLRRKKTVVKVTDLLGCTAGGPATEDALDRTPGAIRDFPCFMQRHGQAVDPDESIEAVIAGHVTEGVFLGNGDPSLVFPRDLEPLTSEVGLR